MSDIVEWTEGVSGDGAVIIRDGQPVPISEVLKALNQYERLRELTTWRPIETAPKDGEFLLWGRTDNTWDGLKYDDYEKWGDERWYLLWAQFEDKTAPNGRKFCVTELDGIGQEQMKCWAKYWAPLPPPPETP